LIIINSNYYHFIFKDSLALSSYISSFSTSTIISISTGVPKGSIFVPIAERACLPFSPNIFIKKSEAPFITYGC
jgi:hypothetical protein